MEAIKSKQLLRLFRITTCRLIGMLFLMAVGVAQATIVNYDGGTGYATGIDDLNVGGTLYNVEFIDASYDSVFSSVIPTFFGSAAGANEAANAIMDVLNAETAVPEINEFPNEVLWVAYDVSGSNFYAAQTGHNISTDPWQRFGNFFGDRSTDWGPWYFARFSTAVPEPGTIWLLSAGLLGFFMRRKHVA